MNHRESSEQPFDFGRAMENLGEDEGLFKDLVAVFLAESVKQLRSLKEGLASGHGDQVRRAAHTIKGSVGVFLSLIHI